jgi:hypothetical protein
MRFRDSRGLATFLTLLLCCVFTLPTISTADSLKTDTSLAWAPSSVGFYASMLRFGEIWDRFMGSNAYARLQELPVVQMGMAQLKSQWEQNSGPATGIRAFLEDPQNAGLLDLAKQAFREEFFVLGDKNVAELIYLANSINRENQKSQFAAISGKDVDPDAAKNAMIDSAIQAAESMDVPNIVLGFRVQDSSLAAAQIGRIAELLRETMGGQPELVSLLKERDIEGSKFVQMSFRGEMIPWDEALEDENLGEEQVQRLRKALQDRSVHITVGVHDQYFLFVAGSINNPLKLFKNKKLLFDRPEFKRLRDMDGKNFTSVSYASEEFMRKVSRPADDIDNFVAMAQAMIPQAQLGEALENDLKADVGELAEDIKKIIPQNGAVIAFEYEADGGYEGFTQNWTENLTLDGSKRLDILDHVGGDPLCVFAARMKKDSPLNGLFSKWSGKAIGYAERFAMREEPDEEDVELYEAFKTAMVPFGERFAKATREHFAPAMDDGQIAVIFDSKLDAKTQWHPMMPASDEPLGMFEFAHVYGVADQQQLETAFEQYKTIANEAIDDLKVVTQENQQKLMERLEGQAQMLPMAIATLRLPNPQTGETDAGKLFFLSTFQQVGLDAAIAPSWGWSEDVLVVANSPDAASRILANHPIEGPLADQVDRPLAGACYVNFEALMETIKPWVNYGLTVAAEQQDNEMISMVIPQVETVIDVLKCFQQHSSVTFVDGDSMVTHYRQGFADLP